MYDDDSGGGGCLGLLIIYALLSGAASVLSALLPVVFIAIPVLLLVRLLMWASKDSKKKKFEMEMERTRRQIEEQERREREKERERARAEEEKRQREIEALREKKRLLEQIESFEKTHSEARVTTVPQTYLPAQETYPPTQETYPPASGTKPSVKPANPAPAANKPPEMISSLKSAPASGQDIRSSVAKIYKSGDMYRVVFPEYGVSGIGCATKEATAAFAKEMLAEVIIANEKKDASAGSEGSATDAAAAAALNVTEDAEEIEVSVDLTAYLTDLLRDGLTRFDSPKPGTDPDSQEAEVRQEYIDSLRSFYEFTNKPDLKAKVRRLESEIIDIFLKTENDPSSADKARKFFTYYLPTISNVLEKYKSMESLELRGESMGRIVKDTHDLLNISNTAVSNLKESLFEKDLINSSVDLDVMKSMLIQDGLLDD